MSTLQNMSMSLRLYKDYGNDIPENFDANQLCWLENSDLTRNGDKSWGTDLLKPTS